MKHFVSKKTKHHVCHSKECDHCGKVVVLMDSWEFQEFLSWRHDCGYGSRFGDGSKLEIDLCQDCIHKLLSKEMRITKNEIY